jgi:serine/threonine protein kinase
MDYKKKYLKYKNKYENLKGGVLVFDTKQFKEKIDGKENIINKHRLLKTKMVDENLTYENIDMDSNSFTGEQRRSIETMTNFFFPNIDYDGKKLNYGFIKDVMTIGAGAFGVTIAEKDILIKIFKKDQFSIKEIQSLEDLFNNPDPALSPPESLNRYYGFISGKNVQDLVDLDKIKDENINLIGNVFNNPLFKFNKDQFYKKIKGLGNNDLEDFMKDELSNDLIFAFFEKADGDLNYFYKNVLPRLEEKDKVIIASQLFAQIKEGFDYLHKKRYFAHYDIKAANMVYKELPGKIKFQIIDFGGLTKIDENGDGRITVHTPFYLNGSPYMTMHSYMYDYYCLMFPVLFILGVNIINPLDMEILSKILFDEMLQKKEFIEQIQSMIEKVNIKFRSTLPKPKENPDLNDSYRIIILWTLFSCKKYGMISLKTLYESPNLKFLNF